MSIPERRALFNLADAQGGYFTAAQAHEVGYSYPQQHYHKTRGNWLEAGWGLYRLHNYPLSPDEHLVRLTLWSRNRQGEPQGVFSHETALYLHDLSDVLPDKLHLSVPKGFRKRSPPGVILHKNPLERKDIQARHGYRVTIPLRTLLDAAASSLSPEHLEKATEDALKRGLLSKHKLLRVLEETPEEVRSRFAFLR